MQKYILKNLDCADCAANIEENLKKLGEVRSVSINFSDSSILIDVDDAEKIFQVIKNLEPKIEILTPDKKDSTKSVKLSREIDLLITTILIYIFGLLFKDNLHHLFRGISEYIVFLSAYLLAGGNVIYSAIKKMFKGKFFDEHFLMTISTLGAIAIGNLPEAVGVMLFYQIGEFLQNLSLNKSRRSIKSLLEIKPNYANLKINGETKKVLPEEVLIGQTIVVKPGEKIPLDGEVLGGTSQIDTSPLTGEPIPKAVNIGDSVLAGTINQSGLLTLKVTKLFVESSVARILELVESASSKKAETEKFISSFSRIYTPIVVSIAVLIAFVPHLFFDLSLTDWIYRALVLLVISCPCALVISIPLGYFGGIGAASRKGILVKGSNYLDALAKVKTIVFDKTGTLTKGIFEVTEVISKNGFSKEELLRLAAYAESQSNHPLAVSIRKAYGKNIPDMILKNYQELPGIGIIAEIEGKKLIAGNDLLLHRESIKHSDCNLNKSVVHIAIDGKYAGYIIISDELKIDSGTAINKLKESGVEKIYMLTGDNRTVAQSISDELNLDGYFAELLPESKVLELENIIHKQKDDDKIAFIGDGINDAPVIARADVGIAMGALGSDLAIETADVVLMTDNPSKVADAILIAKRTRKIVWQNIAFALGVKTFFIILSAFGIATMWEAVFADMGVAIIAILNSLRVLK